MAFVDYCFLIFSALVRHLDLTYKKVANTMEIHTFDTQIDRKIEKQGELNAAYQKIK